MDRLTIFKAYALNSFPLSQHPRKKKLYRSSARDSIDSRNIRFFSLSTLATIDCITSSSFSSCVSLISEAIAGTINSLIISAEYILSDLFGPRGRNECARITNRFLDKRESLSYPRRDFGVFIVVMVRLNHVISIFHRAVENMAKEVIEYSFDLSPDLALKSGVTIGSNHNI